MDKERTKLLWLRIIGWIWIWIVVTVIWSMVTYKYRGGALTLNYVFIFLVETAVFLIPGEALMLYSLKFSRSLDDNNEPKYSKGALKWMIGVGIAFTVIGGLFTAAFILASIKVSFANALYTLGLSLLMFLQGLAMVITASKEKKKWISS
ncbi:MAG: hypothetical protein ACM3PP_05975 [Candidatus Saccharibacteria bacterium]